MGGALDKKGGIVNEITNISQIDFTKYSITKFGVPWCGHCQNTDVAMIEVAKEINPLKVQLNKVNIESKEGQKVAMDANLTSRGVPAIQICKYDPVKKVTFCNTQSGALTADAFRAILKKDGML